MRIRLMLASTAFAAATCFGAAVPAHAELQLSKCKTRALIGAGVGAVAGSLIAGKGDRTEGALIGGALGAAGTFGVCKWMDARSEARVQSGYQQAVTNNKSYSTKWTAEDGSARSLKVDKPKKVAGATGNCKQITASMSTPGGPQQMPAETYCQGADGVWRPA